MNLLSYKGTCSLQSAIDKVHSALYSSFRSFVEFCNTCIAARLQWLLNADVHVCT